MAIFANPWLASSPIHRSCNLKLPEIERYSTDYACNREPGMGWWICAGNLTLLLTAPSTAERSPTFQEPGTPLDGLAGTQVPVSRKEQVLSFKISPVVKPFGFLPANLTQDSRVPLYPGTPSSTSTRYTLKTEQTIHNRSFGFLKPRSWSQSRSSFEPMSVLPFLNQIYALRAWKKILL